MEATPFVRKVIPLEPMIRDVVQLRNHLAQVQSIVAAARATWELNHSIILADAKRLQEELGVAESDLRARALDNYLVTQNKQVAPGIVIRVNHKAVYDVKAASEWSKAHGGIAHVFDAKTFEKLAQAGQASDIVSIEDVPIATLAKDLGKEDA